MGEDNAVREVTELREFFGTAYEMKLIGLSLLLGIALGSIFDLLRAIRRSFKHSDFMVFAEDMAFGFVFGISWFIFCVELCFGALRGFVLIGMAIGFMAYTLTAGKYIADMLAVSIKTFVKIFKKMISVLCVVPFFKKSVEK